MHARNGRHEIGSARIEIIPIGPAQARIARMDRIAANRVRNASAPTARSVRLSIVRMQTAGTMIVPLEIGTVKIVEAIIGLANIGPAKAVQANIALAATARMKIATAKAAPASIGPLGTPTHRIAPIVRSLRVIAMATVAPPSVKADMHRRSVTRIVAVIAAPPGTAPKHRSS